MPVKKIPKKRPKQNRTKGAVERRRVKRRSEKLVSVYLRQAHSVNGRFFGPGTVLISKDLERQFLSEEQAHRFQEIKLRTGRGVIIGRNRVTGVTTTRDVPPELFDVALEGSLPITGGEE